jgi:diaminopimelate decarboxylase
MKRKGTVMSYYSETVDFYGGTNPQQLIAAYGSPVYVYNERILRERCREMKRLLKYPGFNVTYSTKANSNLRLLEIVRSEGLNADAMSPGEMHLLLAAGFQPEDILFIGNNVSGDEMRFAIEREITVSVDSLAQLELFGRINPGGRVALRFNGGIGAGHHEKVVTAGTRTKFGVNAEYIPDVKRIMAQYRLQLAGVNQHIGSLFMNETAYLAGSRALLAIAAEFADLEFIDLGGGFGIPYHKQAGEARLDLTRLGSELGAILNRWVAAYGKQVQLKIEPGRYLVAECGVLLGTVHAVKENAGTTYLGTDLGFNVLARPILYDAHHDIEVYREGLLLKNQPVQPATVVGNICETGDIIAKDRELPAVREGDLLGVMDAGAYGYIMSSNYNSRLRPAEVLIQADGTPRLIRRRETLEDLMAGYL